MKNQLYFIVTIVALLLFSSGCANRIYLKGNKDFDRYDYTSAAKHYQDAIDAPLKNEDKLVDAKRKLAESYRRTNQYDKAESAYKVLVEDRNNKKSDLIYYARVLQINGKCPEAVIQADKYLASRSGKKEVNYDSVAVNIKRSCEGMPYDTSYIVKLIELKEGEDGKDINKVGNTISAFSPVKYKDGILFTSDLGNGAEITHDWTERPFFDLYYGRGSDSVYSNVEAISIVNEKFHDGPATFNKMGDVMYATASNYRKSVLGGGFSLKKDDKDVSNLQLYKSIKDGDSWTEPELLSDPLNKDAYSYGHPALSTDDKKLYFISDDPDLAEGHVGATDVYVMDLESGEIKHLGNEINTVGMEMFPFVHWNEEDQEEYLYFSSDGQEGLGGLDVFRINLSLENPKVEQLPMEINSVSDDFGILVSEHTAQNFTGYLSSNRSNNDGVDKIYAFEPIPVRIDSIIRLVGLCVDNHEVPIAGASIELILGGLTTNSRTDNLGKFGYPLEFGNLYNVTARKDGYGSDRKNVSTIDFIPLSIDTIDYGDSIIYEFVVDVKLVLCKKTKPFELVIHYDFDKAKITPRAADTLNVLVSILNKNPNVRIELGSHTDIRGSDRYNEGLSRRRANSAYKYLITQGYIPKDRICHYEGYGEKRNRHTEQRILEVCGSESSKNAGYGTNTSDATKIVQNSMTRNQRRYLEKQKYSNIPGYRDVIECVEVLHDQNRRTEVTFYDLQGNIVYLDRNGDPIETCGEPFYAPPRPYPPGGKCGQPVPGGYETPVPAEGGYGGSQPTEEAEEY